MKIGRFAFLSPLSVNWTFFAMCYC